VIFWKYVKESQLKVKNFTERMLEKQSENRRRALRNIEKICKKCWRAIHWVEIFIIAVEILHIFR
jgi:hypothetical protein